ncbi:MAG: hypothetical protein SOZ34_07960 [Clostridia bacterium]|nr:hypothetical protein [Clostridia bacterium]
MARKSRQISKTGIYHVIMRGYDDLFLSQADWEEFYNLLKKYFSSPDSELYAYSMEKDKVHMALYTGGKINEVIKPLCTSYARYYNRTYNNSGKIFYDRFISVPIENDNMLKDVIIFINYKMGAKTSIDEYRKNKVICSVESINNKIGLTEIVKPKKIRLMTDDYNYMSDDELKNIIENTYNIEFEKLEKPEKLKIIADINSSANLGKARLCRLFGISVPAPVKKKEKTDETKQNKKDTDKNTNNGNNNLSVWLL